MEVTFTNVKTKTFVPRYKKLFEKMQAKSVDIDLSISRDKYDKSKKCPFLSHGYFSYWKQVLGEYFTKT